MEDKKKDELKSAMGGGNLTQEQLQEQLKNKIKKASETRTNIKNSSSRRATPNSFEQLNRKKNNHNKILIVLLGITTILLFIAIYIFNKSDKKVQIIKSVTPEEKISFKKLYNSKKYATFNCYSFKSGKISFPIKECKQQIDEFLTANKEANRFEIVPIISQNDSVIYQSIEKDIENSSKELQKKIKEYLFIGLATERILESVWYIKKTLGEDTIVSSSQYYVKSDNENEQGVIIRAYH